MEEHYRTIQPIILAIVVLCVFVVTSIVFCLFDSLARRQQQKVMTTTRRQNLIVSSLFPKNIQEQIISEMELSKAGKA